MHGLFVGRERERAVLAAAVTEAQTCKGSVWALAGEPGIGKTSLAGELGAGAEKAGFRVVWGRCWEGGGAPPYWPWTQIVRELVPPDAAASGDVGLAQLLPELRGGAAKAIVSTDEARFLAFESLRALFQRVSEAQPHMLVLDDVHAADIPSLELLQLLAPRVHELALLVCATYRSAEARADVARANAIGAVERSANVIRVPGLDATAIGELVEAALGQAPPHAFVVGLLDKTGGNPLFLSEILRLVDFAGIADMGSGAAALATMRVPDTVQQMLRRRIDLLVGPSDAGPLDVAAVLGRDFELPLLRDVWDGADEELIDVVQAAVRAGLLHEDEQRSFSYRFTHPLVRETLYQGLDGMPRSRLHRRVAEALEARYGAGTDRHVVDLAHHWFEAGALTDVSRAVDYNVRAARRASDLFAYDDAERCYQRALEIAAFSSTVSARDRATVLLELGEVRNRAGDIAGARASFLEAAELARAVDDADLLARAAVGYGRESSTSGVVDDALVALLDEALLRLGDGDSALWVDVATRLVIELQYAQDDAALARRAVLADAAVAMARRLGQPRMLSYAIEATHLAAAGPDNVRERLRAGADIITLADAAGRREGRQSGHVWRAAALLELGDVAGFEEELETYATLAAEIRQPAHLWYVAMLRSTHALLLGAFRDAERLITEALTIGEEVRSAEASEYHIVQRWMLLRELGRLEELAALEPLLRQLARRHSALPAFQAALGCTYLDTGRHDEARRELDGLARDDAFAGLPRNLGWLAALALLAELCVGLDAIDHAAVLYDLLEPYGTSTIVLDWSMASFGSAERFLGVLAAATGRPQDAARHFDAAIERNAMMGARPAVARSRAAYAALLLSSAPARARTLATQALGAARELGMEALARDMARLLGDSGSSMSPQVLEVRGAFHREGEYWSITYEQESVRLKDSRGLALLAVLLKNPGREFHVLDLVGQVRGTDRGVAATTPDLKSDIGLGDAGPILDSKAKAAYRARLLELRGDVDEAEANNDTSRAARAREELDFLARELAGAVGLGGRDVRAASVTERARVSVTKSVRTALKRIAEAAPGLGGHLTATIRTGYYCSYNPDPRLPIVWRT